MAGRCHYSLADRRHGLTHAPLSRVSLASASDARHGGPPHDAGKTRLRPADAILLRGSRLVSLALFYFAAASPTTGSGGGGRRLAATALIADDTGVSRRYACHNVIRRVNFCHNARIVFRFYFAGLSICLAHIAGRLPLQGVLARHGVSAVDRRS